jgi:hypothetical protein
MSDVTGTFLSLIFLVGIFGLIGAIWWKIFSKAGYNGAMGLLMFVPIVNLIMIGVLAFSEWPIQKELSELRSRVNY